MVTSPGYVSAILTCYDSLNAGHAEAGPNTFDGKLIPPAYGAILARYIDGELMTLILNNLMVAILMIPKGNRTEFE